MADLVVKIASHLELSEIESRCEVEQRRGFQLQKIEFGTTIEEGVVIQVSKAEFNSLPEGFFDELSFVEVGADNPDRIKQQKEDEGWNFICEARIFVQNHVTPVIVFGKNA